MKRAKVLLPFMVATLGLVGCNSALNQFKDALNDALNDATKPVSERIAVDDATKADVRAETRNMRENQYQISSSSPYDNAPGTVDISSATKETYYDTYLTGCARAQEAYMHYQTGYGFYTEEGGKALEYRTGDMSTLYNVYLNNGTYTMKINGVNHTPNSYELDMCKYMMKLWAANYKYCYSWELNNFMGVSSQLGNEEIHDSEIDFLQNTTFKEYKNASEFTAYYTGIATSAENPNIKVDYMELSYYDYRIQYMLTHGVNTQTNEHYLFCSEYSYNLN